MRALPEPDDAGTLGVAKVSCFRGVRRVQLDLAQITIFTGRNNAGKSSVLEALALAFSSPALRDWLGNDVVRIIVDDKLGGHPGGLLNNRCGKEAAIELEVRGKSRER